jgi:outer membrane protein TolC
MFSLSKFIYFLFLTLISSFTLQIQAQDTLSLEQAIEIALSSNYGVKVARNNSEALQNNATKGNAGLLPTVTASGNLSYASNDIRLKIANGQGVTDVNQNSAATWSSGASVNVNYTLFNGFATIRTYDKLMLNAEASSTQVRKIMETTILNVASQYYNLVTLSETYLIQSENIAISQQRYRRAEVRNEFGGNNKLAILNAEVDLNTDSVNLVTSQLNIQNAKRSFNQLLGRDNNIPFVVSRVVSYETNWNLTTLIEEAKQENATLQGAKYNQSLAELDLKIAEAARSPRVGLSAGYAFSRQDSEAGLLLVNQNIGFSTGLNVAFDIFNGGKKNIQIQNSRIAIDSRQQELKEATLLIEQQIENAYATFQNRIYILRMEEKNIRTAQANFERTEEQFNYGQVSNTQFREAQLNLAQAKNRLSNARYAAKLAELDLQQLSGGILKE